MCRPWSRRSRKRFLCLRSVLRQCWVADWQLSCRGVLRGRAHAPKSDVEDEVTGMTRSRSARVQRRVRTQAMCVWTTTINLSRASSRLIESVSIQYQPTLESTNNTPHHNTTHCARLGLTSSVFVQHQLWHGLGRGGQNPAVAAG